MTERINIREIKHALKKNKILATTQSPRMGKYTSGEGWGVYDSKLYDFANTLSISLPENYKVHPINLKEERFKKYIEGILSDKEKPDLTAVEFGGPGSKLFRGFTKNFFVKTLGVCLKDIRDQEKKDQDRANNHSVIEEDILDVQSNQLFKKIKEVLGTDKIDLIISRMDGPLGLINKNKAILDRIIRNWYDILEKNGLMFIQFDREDILIPRLIGEQGEQIKDTVKKWADVIKEKYPEIDIQVSGGVLRLHKKFSAPEKLPPATQLFK